MTIAALRALAALEAPSEAETLFGGRSRSWSQVAALWVDLRPSGHRESPDAAGPPRLVETAEAEARAHPAVRRGRRLKAGGEPWRIVAVVPHAARRGRIVLKLERHWP
ncbi:phage head completion protein [Caulobacter mirabilis]|uniref:Phage head-tail adapter protein n=1 Tax=Caulobacter mirabilis TaxID=69666 RepID=A0A2D2AVV0_9CAUL|nr:head-tail adaptor protein [Caulobacter mirabilis]ATQ42134.1 hypothetical protein CSW64_06745 [Caulobacter mirabilis]